MLHLIRKLGDYTLEFNNHFLKNSRVRFFIFLRLQNLHMVTNSYKKSIFTPKIIYNFSFSQVGTIALKKYPDVHSTLAEK